MAMLSHDEARSLLEDVLSNSRADDCIITIVGSKSGNLRFARNTVTTSGSRQNMTVSIQSVFGARVGSASTNEIQKEALIRAMRKSESLAVEAPINAEYMAPLGPQAYLETPTFSKPTANILPDRRANWAAASINAANAKEIYSAGFIEDATSFTAMLNSRGLFAYNRSTGMSFSATMRTPDGTGSGYVARDYNNAVSFNPASASHIAIKKALSSREPRSLEPGEYTVILEPTAAVDLIALMMNEMDARQAHEGRSFLSKKHGGTKLGDRIVDERISITSNPANEFVPRSPWHADGRPQKQRTWIENGVVKNLSYSRFWADRNGVEAIPPAPNIIMAGGDESLDGLIKSTTRGILVTRLWYIRPVDPQTLLYTGLTRDGTFLIQDGQLQYPVNNLRFNESPVIMLNNLLELGQPVRRAGHLIPAMKIRNFTFTSVSDAI